MNDIRRGPLLVTGAVAALGAAVIPAVILPTLWQLSPAYGALFTVLVLGELAAVAAVVVRPSRRHARLVAAAAAALLVTWVLDRVLGWLPDPDPWLPTDGVLGITDDVDATLQVVALLAFGFVRQARRRRVLGWFGLVPVVLGAVVGVATASAGSGLPSTLDSTLGGPHAMVEYCRPNGIPLPMDLYAPSRPTPSAPVAVYVHGGGFMLGDHESDGLGASLANSPGALFAPLRDRLTDAGFVVASVGYRLAPASPWPGPITDVKCAIRFLKAHATELGINPNRVGVWGSSAGGTLAALLGTTDTAADLDVGEHTDQPSTVQAVVNMFGPTDLTNFSAASGFMRTILYVTLGDSPDVRHAASPRTYVHPGMPPFLILHGTDDPLVQQSAEFAAQLRDIGIPVTYIPVERAGHGLDTPGQHPTPAELTTTVVDFLTRTLV